MVNGLDEEWVDLILTARNMGMTVVEVRAFVIGDKEVYSRFVQKRIEVNCSIPAPKEIL